jgi:uncharacterized protein
MRIVGAQVTLDPVLEAEIDRQPYPFLFVTISGAHLYGFPSTDSDYDLRGVHILPASEVVGLRLGKDTIQVSGFRGDLEIDLVTDDVRKFFELLLKKNGSVLEQLYSPLVVRTSPAHEELKAIAQQCITRHHSYHYLGFGRTKWQEFVKEEPHHVKPLLYVYRVHLTGLHLMQTGRVEANLRHLNEVYRLPYLDDLIAHKAAEGEHAVLPEINLAFHQQEYERLHAELDEAANSSTLPEYPVGQQGLHDLLVRLRLATVRESPSSSIDI